MFRYPDETRSRVIVFCQLLSKLRSFDPSLQGLFICFLFVCLFVCLFGQQVVILSGSTTGAFKEQELFTADSWKQFVLSTAMPTSAKLRLVSLIVKTQGFNCKKKLTHLGYVG